MRDLNKNLIFHNYRFWNNCVKEAEIKEINLWIPGSTKVSLEMFMDHEDFEECEKMIFVSCDLFRYFMFYKTPSGIHVIIYTEAFDLQSHPIGENILNQNKMQN